MNDNVSSLYYITGSPDMFDVRVSSNNGTAGYCYYDDNSTIPFIISGGNIYYGEKGEGHWSVAYSIMGKTSDDFYGDSEQNEQDVDEVMAQLRVEDDYAAGRLFPQIQKSHPSVEFPYSVLAFWGDEEDNKKIDGKIMAKVFSDCNISPDNTLVAVFGESEKGYLVPYNSWNGINRKMTDSEMNSYNLHLMSSKNKHDATKDFRAMRDKKLGRKLTNGKGEEMPVAKYRSMLFQESATMNESRSESELVVVYGDPDIIYYELADGTSKELYYGDDGIVFCVWGGMFIIGNEYEGTSTMTHGMFMPEYINYHGWKPLDILPLCEVDNGLGFDTLVEYRYSDYYDEDGNVLDEYRMTYNDLVKKLGQPTVRGRLFVSRGLQFVCFWGQPSKDEAKYVLKNLKCNPYYVTFGWAERKHAREYYETHKIPTLLDFAEGNMNIPKQSDRSKEFAMHLMNAKEKQGATKDFRTIRNRKIGKKLTNANGNEMPMAKYHNIIYQESKGPNIPGRRGSNLFENFTGTCNYEAIKNSRPDLLDVVNIANHKKYHYDYQDPQSFPIKLIYLNGKMMWEYGENGDTHGTIFKTLYHKIGNGEYKDFDDVEDMFEASRLLDIRIWKSKDDRPALLSLWSGQISGEEVVKSGVIPRICSEIGVNPSEMLVFSCGDEINWYDDWSGDMSPESEDEREAKALHMMSYGDKHGATKDFRTTRDKKLGRKLTNGKGEEMSVAKYHNIIYQENKVGNKALNEGKDSTTTLTSNDVVSVYGYPDSVDYTVNGKSFETGFNAASAYPFLEYNGKVYIGDRECNTHLKLMKRVLNTLNPDFDCDSTEDCDHAAKLVTKVISGRAFCNLVGYIGIVFFWCYNASWDNVKRVSPEIMKQLHMPQESTVIAVEDKKSFEPYVVSAEELGLESGINTGSSENSEAREIHLMNSKEKQAATKDFRGTRDKKLGRKLTNGRGEEMPVAKYNSMIRQESKDNRNAGIRIVRLTEQDLFTLITESINNIINKL